MMKRFCPNCTGTSEAPKITTLRHSRQVTDPDGKTFDCWVCPNCDFKEETENKDGMGPGRRYV